jgi:hypothetical protein
MARNLGLASFAGAIVLSLSLVGESRASISTYLASWTRSPEVTGNATWNFISFTNLSPTTIPVVFNETTTSGTDKFTLTIGDSTHLLSPGIYELKYSITLAPGQVFQNASLGATLAGVFPAATITKYLYTSPTFSPSAFSTLTSVNGKSVNTGAVDGLSSLYVDEIISVTGGGVGSISNSFTPETVLPEPASFVVWSVLAGGIALASARRLRRRTA